MVVIWILIRLFIFWHLKCNEQHINFLFETNIKYFTLLIKSCSDASAANSESFLFPFFWWQDTVEELMQAVQARKQRLISGALTDQEVRTARIGELKMLFNWPKFCFGPTMLYCKYHTFARNKDIKGKKKGAARDPAQAFQIRNFLLQHYFPGHDIFALYLSVFC